MFENVLGHGGAIRDVRGAVENGTFPPAVLLVGPRFSGKLTVALELARALTCEGKGAPWSCQCNSCAMHRELRHPELALLGPRYFAEDILAAASAFARSRRSAGRFLFVRAVRKVLFRVDERFWPEQKTRLLASATASVATALDEMVERQIELITDKEIDAIANDAIKLVGKFPSDLYPIDTIRSLSAWLRVTSNGRARVAIFENADRMGDSARNALLKILEEPPSDVFAILTTVRGNAIIPTIRSRVRTIPLPARPVAVEREVLTRIFRLSEDEIEQTATVNEHFSSITASVFGDDRVRFEAAVTAIAIGRGGESEIATIFDVRPKHDSALIFSHFVDLAERAIGERLANADAVERRDLFLRREIIERYRSRVERININPSAAFDQMVIALERSS